MKVDFLAQLATLTRDGDQGEDKAAEALEVCRDFYATLGADAPHVDTVYNDFLAAGGQSTIYKCGTTNSTIEPSVTASKIFFTVEDKNMTELEIINRATADAGVRAPLYYFHENGFIEEFLAGKVDLWGSQTLHVTDRQVWSQVADRVGRLHSIQLDDIDQDKYKHGIEGWWNTRNINEHFDMLKWVMENDYFGNGFTLEKFLQISEITLDELNAEISWVAQLLLDYYDEKETPVLCHNDLHLGNMMLDANDTSGESLILIDFDNTRYGYRAFDFVYHFGYHSVFVETSTNGMETYYPDNAIIDEFLTIYSESYTGKKADVATLWEEVRVHTPYTLLEQIVFLYGTNGLFPRGLRCEYERYAIELGHESTIKCPKGQTDAADAPVIGILLGALFLLL